MALTQFRDFICKLQENSGQNSLFRQCQYVLCTEKFEKQVLKRSQGSFDYPCGIEHLQLLLGTKHSFIYPDAYLQTFRRMQETDASMRTLGPVPRMMAHHHTLIRLSIAPGTITFYTRSFILFCRG